jgi:UDP-GlcNAc:undecaprenyl-phosphate/decaprenyl-phosphate GlcNAc-1-phosphate transferase
MQTQIVYFLLALLMSLITQYLIIGISHRKGIFMDDHESELPQKLHEAPTPRIGGLGIFLGLMLLVIDIEIGRFLLIASVPAFLAGFLEDLFGNVSPTRRLLIMSVGTFIAIYAMQAFVTDFGIIQVPAVVGMLITIIAILGLTNGMNLIDGFNGLSSGVSIIIFATHFATATLVGDKSIALVSLVAIGSLLGFYAFNYPKGKIFLGDGGAYIMGFILSIISILIVKRNHLEISPFYALLTLIYPVWEVIFSFTRRILNGLSPLHPDSEHFHQRVFRTWAKNINPNTSLIIYPLVILFNVFAVITRHSTILLTVGVILFIGLYTVLYKILSSKEALKA